MLRPRFASLQLLAAITFATFLALTVHDLGRAQEPAAKQVPAGDAKGKGAQGGVAKGKGKAPVDTLGPGPWDLKWMGGNAHVSVVTKGLDHPWGLAFLPNGDMLITERGGRLRVFHDGVLNPTPLGPMPATRAVGLGGLLDIALHPKFADNHLVYFVYGKPGDDEAAKATVAVARARYDGGTTLSTTLSNVQDVYVAKPSFGGRATKNGCCGQGPNDGNSQGARIVFDRAGYLYVTIGDRNFGELAQDTTMPLGKIMRLRDDGSVPPDNPFSGRAGFLPEIYSYGHRNPLGLTVHPVTGEIWESEFGPRGGDEVNRIKAGANYGWMLTSNGMNYDGTQFKNKPSGNPGLEDPVLFFIPSINPGNLVFYNGDKFLQWKGDLLMAAMTQSVLRVEFDAQGKVVAQERMFNELKQRMRDVRVGPDGNVYLLTDETIGSVLKVEPGK